MKELQFPFVGFKDCGKVTKGGGGFTGVDEGGVLFGRVDLLGIVESAASEDTV